jgi:hypothetical protein
MQIIPPGATSRSDWINRSRFSRFSANDLCNGLVLGDNVTLARTPHIDQAIALILRGLRNLEEN